MIKRIIKIFSFFALLQVVIFSCWGDPIEYQVTINNVFFDTVDTEDNDSSIVSPENLVLELFFHKNSSIVNINELSGFVNSAYAFKCDNNFYYYPNRIQNIIITSNKNLSGIEPGNPINELLEYSYDYSEERFELERIYVDDSNEPYNNLVKSIVFKETISSQEGIFFNLLVTFADGNSISKTTETFTIE